MKFRVLIDQDEDGVFVTQVPSLPGCVSQGETRKQAISNAEEAIAAYLESSNARGEAIPPSIDEELVEVAV
jgi:predicted RNase H-like HicB family nuclease